MENNESVAPEAWLNSLTQLVEANRTDLESSFHAVLREALFSRRTTLRPNMLKGIASDEVDALIGFFCQPAYSAFDRGVKLYQMGLSEQTALRMGQVTRQFMATHLENGQVGPALKVIDDYHESLILGYVQTQEQTILKEQELIRSALQTAISRYTVEIKEIEEMAQKATEANQFKTQFIARIGHELRTPLGAMMGMAQMLQEGIYGSLSVEQLDLTQRIINKAEVLKQVFAELLDQSQIESGQLQLKAEPFSPQSLVESIHTNYLPLALQKGISMQVQISSALPRTAVGDKGRIEQIITNLIVNAIKFTEKGGIVVRAFKVNGARWGIEVKDTGIGIAQEHLTYIFEPFRQTDETSGRKHGGVGLGLAIVQQLAAAMDGTVEVKSKFGQGSTFTVILPLHLAT